MKVLILGATGMLGNSVFRFFSEQPELVTYGTCRSEAARQVFAAHLQGQIIVGTDAGDHTSLERALALARPDVVVNCVGLVKQLSVANDPLQAIPINALFPHLVAAMCQRSGARLVHISTDCVFSGLQGNYLESDLPDARDLYGRSKLLGEVDYPHAITLRTSIIGHEVAGHRSLVDWFIAQKDTARGFTKAIFSGLPTVELARIICDFVLPHPQLRGLYHVASEPIDKFSLLQLVAAVYEKEIEIIPDDSLVIDRSLNANRFNEATGYGAPDWMQLVQRMHSFG